MSISWQPGQSDFELAQTDGRILLAPYAGTSPLLNIEDQANGGIDLAKVGAGSKFVTVGNYEKRAGAKLANKPNLNKIMSSGKGSPTRNIFSESEKSLTYVPQETKLINLQNAWGFTNAAVSAPSSKGGFTIGIPEIPARLQWRMVYVAQDYFNGKEVFLYWIANKVEVGDRDDVTGSDSEVFTHGVTLTFMTDGNQPPLIFGMCGAGLPDLIAANGDGALYQSPTGITVNPTSAALTVASGASHTRQLQVSDTNGADRTATASYASDATSKATVSNTGLVTAVAAGAANVTATYNGFTATCAVTVS